MISPSDEPKEVSFNVIRDPFLGYHIIIDTVSFDDTTVRVVFKLSDKS